MSKKLKNIISVYLVIIFLSPTIVKLFDSSFHHHNHFVCNAKTERHFHKYHEICPIPSFDLPSFSLIKSKFETQNTFLIHEILISFISDFCLCNSNYSYLLRAPPSK